MKIHSTALPGAVLDKLDGVHGNYTSMVTVFHAVCFDLDCWAGVAGDGANGSYEWFVSTPRLFETSDCGFGDSVIALREVLNRKIT